MSLWSVVALGIGSMVGAGIFALLGQAALVVGRETLLALAIGGLVALFAGFAYAGLSARYPQSGGIVVFFNLGLPRRLAGALSLLYLANLGISTSLIAKTFGAYGLELFVSDGPAHLANLVGSAALIGLFLLISTGGRAVGRVEEIIVALKVAILLGFLAGGLWFLDLDLHATHAPAGANDMAQAIGLTFFAYAGFGIMANAAGSVSNPARTMRIAFPLAILITAALYVALSVLVLSAIPAEDLAANADTAIASAATPYFGSAGFVIMSLAALLATSSTINANLYSGNEMSRSLGQEGQLPAALGKDLIGGSTLALGLGVAVILVMTNIFHITTIANAAGAIFLFVYLAVFVVAWRLRAETGARAWLLLLGGALMAGVFIAVITQLWIAERTSFLVILAALVIAMLVQPRTAARDPE